MLPSRDHSMALPVMPGSRGDAFVAPLQEPPSCASNPRKPQNVKNAVASHAVDSRTGLPGDLGPMPYVSVALRNVPVGRFLCIFYTSLLLITTSIYARIHAASTNVFTHRAFTGSEPVPARTGAAIQSMSRNSSAIRAGVAHSTMQRVH
jgi:hypothetical protein